MATKTFTAAAVLVALVAAKSDHTDSFRYLMEDQEYSFSADAWTAIGAFLAFGWIEQSDRNNLECHSRDLELASGDYQAIRSILTDLGVEDEEEREAAEEEIEKDAKEVWQDFWAECKAASELGAEHGAEHVNDWIEEWRAAPVEDTDEARAADWDHAIKTLDRMRQNNHDWGTSSSEGWALAGEKKLGEMVYLKSEKAKFHYMSGYEAGACKRADEARDELMDERND